jgi:hypothetical protein
MAVVSPHGDGIGEEIEADGRLSRQSKNYQKDYKNTPVVKLTGH